MTFRASMLLMILVAATLAGCTSWYSYQTPVAPDRDPANVRVWRGGLSFDVVGATVSGDSLVGRRGTSSGDAGGRIAIAVDGIDSMFVRRIDPGKTGLLVLGALPAAFAMIFVLDGWLE